MNAPTGLYADRLPESTPTLGDLVDQIHLAKRQYEQASQDSRGFGDCLDIEAYDKQCAAEADAAAILVGLGVSEMDARDMVGGLS